MSLVTVKNVGASVVDLDDGRSLAPGETAADVNLAHQHNDRLVLAGLIAEVSVPEKSPKSTKTSEEK